MKLIFSRQALERNAPVLVCLVMILLLLALPTGFEGAVNYQEAERCSARVLSTDDSAIIDTGLVRSGEQLCELELLDGPFAGEIVTGVNMLNGSLEQDKIFAPGDRALVVVSHDGDAITNVTMSRPLPAGLGGGAGGGLRPVPHFVRRAHRGPGPRPPSP